MRKAKVMLTAIVILGTVGGVLAYKAKRISRFCTAPTVNGACDLVVCQGEAIRGAVVPIGGQIVCTASKVSGIPCATTNPLHFIPCSVATRTTFD